eukprot:GILK01002309.1.p1 GENE.GILK01002309.1~~GILK01002309.1.p1  ORF type:complete len:926 (-),score=268.21 GILK01002309.1:247-3024(-)
MAELSDEIRDISNSLAYNYLEELFKDGRLTKTQVDLFKSKYAKIHEVVLQTYENEKNLLKKAKSLNQELLNEKIKLEKLTIQQAENAATLNNLKQTLTKSEGELQLGEEREAMLQYEMAELDREKADQKRVLEEREREELDRIQPEIDRTKKAVEDLREELTKMKIKEQQERDQKVELTQRMEHLTLNLEKLEESKETKRDTLSKIRTDPERITKQADVIEKAKDKLDIENSKLGENIDAYNSELAAQQARKKEVDELRMDLGYKLEMHRATIEQRERGLEELTKKLEYEKEFNANEVARRVELDIRRKMLNDEAKRETDNLAKRQKQHERAKRDYKKKELMKEFVLDQLPSLRLQQEDVTKQLQHLHDDRQRQKQVLEELKQEVDIFISTYLKQEQIEKDKKEELEAMVSSIKDMEGEVSQLIKDEYKLTQHIAFLTSQREKMAREASHAMNHARETREELKVKDLVILDLTKKHHETNHRLKEFSALYDVVKNERNKYVNWIQSSSQGLAEMKEKIKILQNEVDILRNESHQKDKALNKTHQDYQQGVYQRDSLRTDLNKSNLVYRQKQELIEQQIIEIDKLNSIINGLERDMLRLKKQYELAVEARNYTGIQLIDRNDELCILYEKSNIQESILRKGELEIRHKEDEIRMLNLELSEVQRQLEVIRRQIPLVPELASQVMQLKGELNDEKRQVEKMSYDLERPDNLERWRKLGGEDPDAEALQAKLQILEERLNDKKEALLEKELVLEEVTSLADKLRRQALDGRQGTLALAEKVNDFQARIKDLTRKMMATVSELSMYQATAMKLQEEKEARERELEFARQRLDQGEPPTDDAEREWYRLERDRIRHEEMAIERAQEAEANNGMAPNVTKTAAEPRPNAYIPDATELAIPRPYGNHAPFKPTETGSSMRHIRKPNPKPLEM